MKLRLGIIHYNYTRMDSLHFYKKPRHRLLCIIHVQIGDSGSFFFLVAVVVVAVASAMWI